MLSATGSNGIFSGVGYVQVPYLADTKIKVTFDNIKINSERQLFEGKIVTTYDKTEKNVQFVQEGVGELFGDAGAKQQKINFEIAEIKKDENGRLIVVGKVDEKTGIAPQLTLPAGSDYQITDNSNKVWAVDEKGEVTSIEEKAETQLANNPTKENQIKSQEQPKTDHFEILWDFSQSEFAFDASGKIPYKALIKGKEETFQVSIHQKDSLSYSFHFQTDKGVKIASQELQKGVYKLSRKGLFDFADEELWVVAKNTKTDKEEIISKCILVHLPEKQVNVMLVPLKENLDLQTKITEIQQFYTKVGVNLAISVDTTFPITESISTENQFGDLSTYSPDQQHIISAYTAERSPKSDVYYIFVGEQTSSQQGYMRLGGQFGFVMDNNARTIAHELGHGIFKLEHPFKKDKSQVGKTTSIMDYGSGTDFLFPEWKQIGDPKLKLYAFQGQQEGEYNDDEYIRKIISRMECGRLNGDDEISKDYFHKSGTFKAKDFKVTINKNKKINLIYPEITTEKQLRFSSDAISVTKNITVYSLDFGGVIFIFEDKKNVDKFLKRIFPEDVKYAQKQHEKRFDELWNKVKNKKTFTEIEINILKEIVLCTGAKISPSDRYSVIKKSFVYSSREKVEDLVLDLLQTTSNNDAKSFLAYLKKDIELVKNLIENMNDVVFTFGNENNAKRLRREFLTLYKKAYPRSERTTDQVIKWLLGELADENTTYDLIKEQFDKKTELTVTEINEVRKQIETIKDSIQKAELYLKLQEKVPYHNQRNNNQTQSISDRMCNLTSQAMCFEYLGVSCPEKDVQFEDYLEKIRIEKSYGERTTSEARRKIAKDLDVCYKYEKMEKNFSNNKEKFKKVILPELQKGNSVMLSIWPKCKGHLVRLQNITDEGLIVDDPFGKVTDFMKRERCEKGGYDSNSTKEENSKGSNNLWKWDDIKDVTIKYVEIYSKCNN